jgi:hypothetical protein
LNRLRVACVCGQYGAAIGLAPVIRKGIDLHGWKATVLTYGEAAAAFQAEGIPTSSCDNNFSVTDATDSLSRIAPGVILLGSDASRHVEKIFIRAAASLQIFTIMFVDFWSNYKARFADQEGSVEPDIVAVVDACMAADVKGAGIPSDRVRIVGSPSLEREVRIVEDYGAGTRNAMRIARNIATNTACVLFLSSPTSELDYGDLPHLESRKHSLWTFLDGLAKDLSDISRQIKREIYLMVRPHPREGVSSFKDIDSRIIQVDVSADLSPLAALCIADLVIGLDTMMLLEALLSNKAVLSLDYVRPLNGVVRALIDSTGGLVLSKEELPFAIRRCLDDDHPVQLTPIQDLARGATDSMVDLVMKSHLHQG